MGLPASMTHFADSESVSVGSAVSTKTMNNSNTEHTENSEESEPSTGTTIFLTQEGIQERMQCTGSVAYNIEEAFVTVSQLLEAIASDDPLTSHDGIGPQTAEVIKEWYENRKERERYASNVAIEVKSNTSMNITNIRSWAAPLGISLDENNE